MNIELERVQFENWLKGEFKDKEIVVTISDSPVKIRPVCYKEDNQNIVDSYNPVVKIEGKIISLADDCIFTITNLSDSDKEKIIESIKDKLGEDD